MRTIVAPIIAAFVYKTMLKLTAMRISRTRFGHITSEILFKDLLRRSEIVRAITYRLIRIQSILLVALELSINSYVLPVENGLHYDLI